MRLSPHYFAILSIAIYGSPCDELCSHDGPSICTHGSWPSASGSGIICHAYFRTSGDGGRCYHSTETASSCPDTLPPLTLVDAEAVVAPLRAIRMGDGAAGVIRDGAVGGFARNVRQRVEPVETFTPRASLSTARTPVLPISLIESSATEDSGTAALVTEGSSSVPPPGHRVIEIEAVPPRVSTGPIETVNTTPIPLTESTTSFPPLNRRRPRVMPVRTQGSANGMNRFPPPIGRRLVRQSAGFITSWPVPHDVVLPVSIPAPVGPVSTPDTTPEVVLPVVLYPGPVRRFPTLQSAADHIGSVFVSRRDWQHLAVTIASVLSQLDITEFSSFDEANDFWERARGNSLLELARANPNCQSHDPPNACFALMMLIGNMPLPADIVDEVIFLARIDIFAFVQANAAQLGHRLIASLHSLSVPMVPSYLVRQIDIVGIGLYHGFAANWISRFPGLLVNDDLVRAALRHGIYRHAARNMSRVGRRLDMQVNRQDALLSSGFQLAQYSPVEVSVGIESMEFIGEDAFGDGLIQEWFSLMDTAINGIVFTRREDSDIHEISRGIGSVGNYETISTAVGRYFALCIIHGTRTSLNLPIGFVRLLMGETIAVDDIQEIDAQMFNTLSQFENANSEDELTRLMYGMEDEPLMGSGASEPLSLANKDDQIRAAVTNLITNQSPEIFGAISTGFLNVIPRELLREVSPRMLKNLICGSLEPIDGIEFFNNIRFQHSIYWTPERIGWFRDVLTSFSQERMRNFLRYITGYQVLPAGGFGAIGSIGVKAHLEQD